MTRLPLAITLTLSLALIACGDKGEDDTGDAGPADVDGDGFTVEDDCDDNDGSVYPGAEDAWYDGVDSDCAADDDYDADVDGFRSDEHGGPDCDDADAAIYPGATETWYDGVDSDCAGDNDNDADVDGFDGLDGGGDDCDDADATVYPGAADTWYDGVDSDCVGDSDYDADADGFDAEDHSGDDCNDTDADIRPDAEEVWYDGVDGNCNDDDDFDADADGQQSDDHGGSDCDDLDDTVMYGVTEKIDGKDTDCDGSADIYSTDEYDTFGGSNVTGIEQEGGFGWPLVVGDFDFDGTDDVMVGEEGTASGHLYTGATLSAGSGTTSSSDLSMVSDYGAFTDFAAFEDLDGAGTNYIAMATNQAWAPDVEVPSLVASAEGAVWVFTQAELASATTLDDAGTVIWGGDFQEFGAEVVDGGDLDGDGLSELVATAQGAGEQGVYIFSGATVSGGSATWSTADATARWHDDNGEGSSEIGAEVWSRTLASLGDIDGDGYGELLVGQPDGKSGKGRLLIIEGGLSLTSDDFDNLYWAVIDGESSNQAVGAAVATGDLDGDAVTDVVIGAPGQDSLGGRAHVVMGADLTGGAHNISDVSYVSYTGTTVFGEAGSSMASGYDVDGDGKQDLAVGGPYDGPGGTDAGEAYLVISGSSGSRALADSAAQFYGSTDDDFVGTSVGLGDFNADGMGDVIFAIIGEDGTLGDEGAFTVGFSGY